MIEDVPVWCCGHLLNIRWEHFYFMRKSNWKHIRTLNVNNHKEFIEVLNKVKSMCNTIYYRKFDREIDGYIGCSAYIEETSYKIKITYKPTTKAITYVFDKDENYQINLQPTSASAQMSRVYKIEKTKDILRLDPEDIGSAKPLLYKNEKYDGTATNAFEYDMTQAYAQMLKLPLPKTETCKYNKVLKKGQIGFKEYSDDLRLIVEPGTLCDYVFETMESPYIKWIDRLFERCKNSKDEHEKTEIKSIYRFAVGNLQNQNPFWRATIVGRCNRLVESLMDENTIYCNTDSIISEFKRPDIESNEYLWKLKRENQIFKWEKDKDNYQWNLEIPVMRGPYKRYIEYYNKTHEKPWNILENKYPENCKTKFGLSYVYSDSELKIIKSSSLKLIENKIGA